MKYEGIDQAHAQHIRHAEQYNVISYRKLTYLFPIQDTTTTIVGSRPRNSKQQNENVM